MRVFPAGLGLDAEYAARGFRAARPSGLDAGYAAREFRAEMARIVRGSCEFAGRIIIVRNSAPFRAILGADLRVRARI